ncbi:putative flavin carrier protein 2 precursor [Cladorrhinum samala]|uniref:Flavin carrier protein 2 n=1 Tax=Cladorrhinum samala TaxID=585594 RepID=A0AAV9I500_9PEZI|nr:putative flavin carrier protein 2 precursor [Cladorrhinum samala]
MKPWGGGLRGPVGFLFCFFTWATVSQARTVSYSTGTDKDGITRQLASNRDPSLFTGDYGNCLGGESPFQISKYDAAYYADNMTIAFHLEGSSYLDNETFIMHISVDAYGQNRFEMTFNPCNMNIASLCPLRSSVPILAWAEIRVGPEQIGGIPDIAYRIPDFEGTTTLRIFRNSTRTQVGCLQAVMKNGNSVSQPYVIAPALGIFTLVAALASFFTAIYGVSVPHMRMHHSHSLSVWLVFETWQEIFLSGALNVSWPSVLVAWRTNFAWAAGFVWAPPFTEKLKGFTGLKGSVGKVGGVLASKAVDIDGRGEELVNNIYGRYAVNQAVNAVAKRASESSSDDPWAYNWNGDAVEAGMPLPGTWPGFAGTLLAVHVPAADAFMVVFIWFLVVVGMVLAGILGLKMLLEGLVVIKWIKKDRLEYFRSHWVGFLGQGLMRTCVIGFFTLMTLILFEFAIRNAVGPVAVAALMFLIVLMGLGLSVAHACRTRTRDGRLSVSRDRAVFYRCKMVLVPVWESSLKEHEVELRSVFSLPMYRIRNIYPDPDHPEVHMDQGFIKRFGWMTTRYRQSRWWFLAYYLTYLFVRAAFLGGGSATPKTQICGLLIWDTANLILMAMLNPFESARNTAMGAWILNICRIVTTGISIAFLPELKVDRIITTALGIIIIVIHSLVAIALLILIILGAISARLSLLRNQENFTPRWLDNIRIRWYEAMDVKRRDSWKPPPSNKVKRSKEEEEVSKEPATPPEPHFSVASIRRHPKIEDEDPVNQWKDSDSSIVNDLEKLGNVGMKSSRQSRAVSARSSMQISAGSLPRTARVSRISWSTTEFGDPSLSRPGSALAKRLNGMNLVMPPLDGAGALSGGDGASSVGFNAMSNITLVSSGGVGGFGDNSSGLRSAVGLIKPQSSLQTMRTGRSSITAVGSTTSRDSTPLPSPGFPPDGYASSTSGGDGGTLAKLEEAEDKEREGVKDEAVKMVEKE